MYWRSADKESPSVEHFDPMETIHFAMEYHLNALK